MVRRKSRRISAAAPKVVQLPAPLTISERIEQDKKELEKYIAEMQEYKDGLERTLVGIKNRIRASEERLTNLERHVG